MHKLLITTDGPNLVQVLQLALAPDGRPEICEVCFSGYRPSPLDFPVHPNDGGPDGQE